MKTLATSKIFANPNNVHKFCKYLHLATKTCYMVLLLVHVAATWIGKSTPGTEKKVIGCIPNSIKAPFANIAQVQLILKCTNQ